MLENTRALAAVTNDARASINSMRALAPCAGCGTKMAVRNEKVKRAYCSKECLETNPYWIIVKCAECGNDLRRTPSKMIQDGVQVKKHFCDIDCKRANFSRGVRVEKNCLRCGGVFVAMSKRMRSGDPCDFCSRACKYAHGAEQKKARDSEKRLLREARKLAKEQRQKIAPKKTYSKISNCGQCGAQFSGAHESRKYCSNKCLSMAGKESAARAWAALTHSERRAANKKIREKYGKNSKHSRRAKKYGCEIERGINVTSALKKFGPRCAICGIKTKRYFGANAKRAGVEDNEATLGHIDALSNGGSHTWKNVHIECRKCNTAKGVRSLGQIHFGF